MKNVLKKLGIVLVVLIVLFVLVGLFLPTKYSVNRSITISANADEVHKLVGELTKWDLWAPWKEQDPTIKTTFGKKTTGVGASQSWTAKEGGGSLVFTMCSPEKGIEYDLTFNQGDSASKCKCSMLYQAKEKETTVVWNMAGSVDTPIIGGYFAAMMDSMVGSMFEHGLNNLKGKVEKK